MAAASWHLIERPILRLKDRFPYRRDDLTPEVEGSSSTATGCATDRSSTSVEHPEEHPAMGRGSPPDLAPGTRAASRDFSSPDGDADEAIGFDESDDRRHPQWSRVRVHRRSHHDRINSDTLTTKWAGRMNRSRYLVGIDLGTTNCAVAYVDTQGRERPSADIRLFDVPQLVAPARRRPGRCCPRSSTCPATHELPPGAARLPWNEGADRIVGEFARIQGAQVPGHLVTSAKSWLCHAGRRSRGRHPALGRPAGGQEGLAGRGLGRLTCATSATPGTTRSPRTTKRYRLEEQEVVLTVPASFDEAARELTLEAAKPAGLATITLLEEPQAAFYCWIVSHQDGWQREVRAGELILVCDIGGGTTDFSLITVVETPTGPGFRRVAVGDHLMLGGDNIDLALAHHVEKKLGGVRLDAEQWSALRYACRTAKEKLLARRSRAERWPVTIAGRGSRIIGGSIQSELTRERGRVDRRSTASSPGSAAARSPQRAAKLGLAGVRPAVRGRSRDPPAPGLVPPPAPGRGDRAGRASSPTTGPPGPTPSSSTAGAHARRSSATGSSRSSPPGSRTTPGRRSSPRVLTNASLDLAVAHGAAYYGVVRRGGGIRIGGGTARSFYVGLESDGRGPALALRRPARRPGRGRDRDRAPRLRPADGPARRLPAREQLGPPRRPPRRPRRRRPRLDPRAAAAPDPDARRPQGQGRAGARPSGGAGHRGRHGRALVPVADRRPPLAAADPAPRPGRTARRRAVPSPGRRPTRSIIEQSELDAAIAAIRDGFPGRATSPATSRARRGWSSGSKNSSTSPRDQWPPSALRALWEPLRDLADQRVKTPAARVALVQPGGLLLRPGSRVPAR